MNNDETGQNMFNTMAVRNKAIVAVLVDTGVRASLETVASR